MPPTDRNIPINNPLDHSGFSDWVNPYDPDRSGFSQFAIASKDIPNKPIQSNKVFQRQSSQKAFKKSKGKTNDVVHRTVKESSRLSPSGRNEVTLQKEGYTNLSPMTPIQKYSMFSQQSGSNKSKTFETHKDGQLLVEQIRAFVSPPIVVSPLNKLVKKYQQCAMIGIDNRLKAHSRTTGITGHEK